MKFKIEKQNDVFMSDRVKQIMTDFDIKVEHSNETFEGDIEIEGEDWNIGLIVGGSGTGKSTIAKELFKDAYVNAFEYDSKSVLDNMPIECDIHEVELAFTSVGFSSPPCWLKPYSVLSTGEKCV